MTFTACDKDDDDDDDKKNDEQVDNKDNKDNDEEGNETSVSSLVGSWKINKSKCSEQVLLNGVDYWGSEEGDIDDPEDPMEEDDFLFGSNPKFNSDGTVTLSTGETGTYKLNGTQLSLTFTENGKTMTIQKGGDGKVFSEEFAESMGIDDSMLTLKSSTVDNFQAIVVNDKELHIKTTVKYIVDFSKMNEISPEDPMYMMTSMFSQIFEYAKISDISNIEFSSVIDQVYDKEGIKLVAK